MTERAGHAAERDRPRPRVSRPALLLAAAGSIVVMVGLVGVVGIVGLAAIFLGTVLAAPAARGPNGGWWNLMASGAVISAAGAIVAIPSDTVGGLLAVIGGAAVLIAAALGFN